jgi:hypothetical protein
MRKEQELAVVPSRAVLFEVLVAVDVRSAVCGN